MREDNNLRDFVDADNPHGVPEHSVPPRLQGSDVLKTLRITSLGELVGDTDEYTVSGTYTESRTLDVATATLADIVTLVATLLTDLKDKGPLG